MRIIRWFRQFRAWVESVEAEREERLITAIMFELNGVNTADKRSQAERIISLVRRRDAKRSW